MLLFWCSCVEFIYYAVILMFPCRVYIMMLFLCFFCGVYLLWWCFFAEFIYHVVPLTFLCRVYIWCWCSFAEFIYYSVAFVGHGSCVPLRSSYIILWCWLIVILVFLCGVGVGWSCYLYSVVELVLVDCDSSIPLWNLWWLIVLFVFLCVPLCWLIVILVFLCGIYDVWSWCLCSFVQWSCDVILVFLNITIQPKLRFFPLFIYREIWQSISDVISNCIIVSVNIQMTFHHKMKLQIWCFLLFQHDSNIMVVSLKDRKFP